jgi:hypothetical protein
MQAALTAWLSPARGEPDVTEVLYGICHLVAGRMQVPGEPSASLSYFVGEASAAARFFAAMLSNGATAQEILSAAQQCGIDPLQYMMLAEPRERPDGFESALAELRDAKSERPVPGL